MRYWRAEFVLRASPSAFAPSVEPSAPMLLYLRLRASVTSECHCCADTFEKRRVHTLEFDQNGVLLQVECEKHGIPNFEAGV